MGQTDITISRRWPAWLNATLLGRELHRRRRDVISPARHRDRGRGISGLVGPAAVSAAASANAAIVRVTAVPSLLVVRPDGHEGLSRLQAAGAWFTADPQAIAACFTKVI